MGSIRHFIVKNSLLILLAILNSIAIAPTNFLIASNTPPSSSQARANTLIISDGDFTGNSPQFKVSQYIEIFEDKQKIYDIKTLLNEYSTLAWEENIQNVPSFGFSKSAFWIRFSVQNNSSKSLNNMLLELNYPPLDSIDFHEIEHGQISNTVRTGDLLPFENRPLHHQNFVFPIKIEQGESKEFVLRIESEGSVKIPLNLWQSSAFIEKNHTESLAFGAFYGIIAVMVFYNFFLFTSVRDSNYLYYVCYIFGFGIFQATIQGYSFQYLWPDMVWLNTHSLPIFSGLSAFSLCVFTIKFLRTKRHVPRTHRFLQFIAVFAFFVVVAGFVAPYKIAAICIALLVLFVDLAIMMACILCLSKGYKPARFFLIAFSTFAIGQSIFGLQTLGVISATTITVYAMQIGSLLEMILLSLALGDKISIREAKARQSIEKLNMDLQVANEELRDYIDLVEEKVEQKTRHITSVMKHIKQGIFTILPEMTIEENHSAYLTTILGKKDLAGENPVDIFFSQTDLTKDELNQMEMALENALNADVICFIANHGHLPNEVIYSRRQIIELDWQPIVDIQDRVERIMVVARDVSKERQLQKETEESRKDLVFIMEIIGVSDTKLSLFFTQAKKYLNECRELLERSAERNAKAVQNIFINYHTLKGNSRNLGFRQLSDIIHQVESHYYAVRAGTIEWDQSYLIQIHERIEDNLAKYIKISTEKLGRDDKRKIVIDESTLDQTIGFLEQLAKNKTHVDEAGKLLETYYELNYCNAVAFLSDVCSQTNRLARDLMKEPPIVSIEGDHVDFRIEHLAFLTSIFTHLLRNSMDHGIESPQLRLEKGKPPQGRILLQITLLEDHLTIDFSDDGAGLNLGKIREYAAQKGLMSPRQADDPQHLASLIMHSGFSTSQSVSDISGRGVGMDAIRSLLQQHGGDLVLQLGTWQPGQQFIAVRFIVKLPNHIYHLRLPSRDHLVA